MKKIKNLKISLLYLLSIFIVVGILSSFLYTKMGHDSDAFGMVFYTSQKPFSFHVFTDPFSTMYLPLNEVPSETYERPSFFSHYRPFQHLIFYFCYSLFGYNAYGFLFMQGVFHALTSVFVYLIFTFFLSNIWAFLLALMFAFHPVHFTSFVGLTCTIIPVFLLLALAVFFYAVYYLYDRYLFYCLSAISFVLSLFCYELPIVFPFILLLYLMVFDFRHVIKKSWIFLAGIFSYLLFRFLLFGFLTKSGNFCSGLFNLKPRIKAAMINWHQAIKPFWGMQDFSKITVALFTGLFISGILLYLIFEKKGRKKMFFYLVAFFMAAWVVTIGNASTRYFYAAIPFFCLIFFELLKFLSRIFPNKIKNIVIATGLLMFVLWGGYRAYARMTNREWYTHKRDLAFMKVAKKYGGRKNLRLIYVGTLHFYNNEIFLMQSGMTQASRIFFKNPSLLAYHVSESKIYRKAATDKNFDITPVSRGYRFISPDPENLFIMCPYEWSEGETINFSMGKIVVNEKLSGWQATDVSFIFDDEWLDPLNLKNTVFLTWDVNNWKFVELDKSHFL